MFVFGGAPMCVWISVSNRPRLDTVFRKLDSGIMPDFLEVMAALNEIGEHNADAMLDNRCARVVPDGPCASCNA